MTLQSIDILTDEQLKIYARSILQNSISSLSGLVAFKNPFFLCGPWGEKYGLLTCQDRRKNHYKDLQPYTEVYNEIKTNRANSSFGVRAHAARAGIKDVLPHLAGRYDPKTGAFYDKDSKKGTFFITPDSLEVSPTRDKEHVCVMDGGVYKMNCHDFAIMIDHALKTNGAGGVEMLLQDYFKDQKRAQDSIIHDMSMTPTIERPIQIYLCGTDDSSWTTYVEDKEAAQDFINQLLDNPTQSFVTQNMRFSN